MTTLVVDLEQLLAQTESAGTEPIPLNAALETTWMQAILSRTDAEVRAPGRVELTLTVFSAASVFVRGRLFASFEVPCARCLEPAHVSADAELCARFDRAAAVDAARAAEEEDEDGISVDPDEPDHYFFSGTQLDLRPMLGETIAMAYPIRALCERGESCRGLCTNCGADLNAQPEQPVCQQCGNGGAVELASETATDEGEEPAWKTALRKLSRSST